MKSRMLAVLGAFALAGGAAMAQDAPTLHMNTPVVSDARPLPAESRDSMGAVLLEHAPVRAQQRVVAQSVAARGDWRDIGRNVMRVTLEAQSAADPTRSMGAPAEGFVPR